MTCELCNKNMSDVLWYDDRLFVLDVNDSQFPGYVRVIWREHITEMSLLSETDRSHLMKVLITVERTMRATMNPDKMNWAQFGNMVPHLHWHLIPRYQNDSHFPESLWGMKQRENNPKLLEARQAQAKVFLETLVHELNSLN